VDFALMIEPTDTSKAAGFVLLITGIPGSGKSTFLDHLQTLGWRVLRGDEYGSWGERDSVAWDAAMRGDDTQLRALAHEDDIGLAIEWGFLGSNLAIVEGLINGGHRVWFFDGDRAAAYESWRRAHPSTPEEVFRAQVRGLDESDAHEISRVIGPRRIDVVAPGPTYLSLAEITGLILAPRTPGEPA
jgi:energy-coupling factor transporter ATP-binding protein EcfA2